MEEPTNDMCELAYDVFDRWGCLKPEYQHHPVKKGTGVWGSELDTGKILFIEHLQVDAHHRRKGYGKSLVEQVWENALEMAADCSFAIVLATYLNTLDVETQSDGLAPKERSEYRDQLQISAEEFWRALGFRRIGSSFYFARARDTSHPSSSLAAVDDYSRPLALRRSALDEDQVFPYNKAILEATDDAALDLLKPRLIKYPEIDPVWLAKDNHENNIAHMAAREGKLETLKWLSSLSCWTSMISSRNLAGETPLEALEGSLEARRTMKQIRLLTVPVADNFAGYTSPEVQCLLLLKGIGRLTSEEIARITYGCTCGQCIGGFISPRLAFALECQGDMTHDMLDRGILLTASEGDITGAEWCRLNDHLLAHHTPKVRKNFETNKSLRLGFANLFQYTAECIRAKRVPTSFNVLRYAENEWPPHTRNYLQRDATVGAVVLQCFDSAIDEDQYLGVGGHQLLFQDQIDKLPVCRNDGEFVFARRTYRSLEGLPAEEVERVGRRIFGNFFFEAID